MGQTCFFFKCQRRRKKFHNIDICSQSLNLSSFNADSEARVFGLDKTLQPSGGKRLPVNYQTKLKKRARE
jgi:hypothetical protein